MAKVLVFGTFDGLHPGHSYFLDQAKKHGDYLVAVVSRDEAVQELKGHPPKFSLEERTRFLVEENIIDEIEIADEELGSWGVLRKHKPEVIVLGYDQVALGESLKERLSDFDWQPRIEIVNALSPEVNKSSILNKE